MPQTSIALLLLLLLDCFWTCCNRWMNMVAPPLSQPQHVVFNLCCLFLPGLGLVRSQPWTAESCFVTTTLWEVFVCTCQRLSSFRAPHFVGVSCHCLCFVLPFDSHDATRLTSVPPMLYHADDEVVLYVIGLILCVGFGGCCDHAACMQRSM